MAAPAVNTVVVYHKQVGEDLVQDFPALVVETHDSWVARPGGGDQPRDSVQAGDVTLTNEVVLQVFETSAAYITNAFEGTDPGFWGLGT
jgi:hypothetical protein